MRLAIAFLILAIGVAAFLIGLGLKERAARDNRHDHSEAARPRPAAAPIDVTAKELQADYDANEVAADNKYRGKALRVSGTVESIGKNVTDDPYVRLRTREFAGVMAFFDETAGPASLRKREDVTLRCVGDGYSIDSPVLHHCTID